MNKILRLNNLCLQWSSIIRNNYLSTGKKMCNLKTENYVSFGGFSEDLGWEDSLSDSSKELLHRSRGGAWILGVLQQKPDS